MKKTFTVEADLLGVIGFLLQRCTVDGGLVYQSDLLVSIAEIDPQYVSEHIARLAIDNLTPSKRDALFSYVNGKSISKEDKRYFYDNGFMFGSKGRLPQLILRRCKILISSTI